MNIVLVSACTNLRALIANMPSYFDDVQYHIGIPFHPDTELTMDIYQPSKKTERLKGGYPIIVFFYGGGWTEGSKDIYRFIGSRFARKGYLVIIPDYRKYPEVRFPVFVEDSALAIGKAVQIAENYGGNPESIFLMGHSAGAHTAVLLATDERFLQSLDMSTKRIKGVIGLAGPYHFTPKSDELKAIFGRPDNYQNMQISNFIDGQEPPLLLLEGEDDTDVKKSNVEKLSAKLSQHGVSYVSKIYPRVDHVGLIASLSWLLNAKAPIEQDILNFIYQYHPQE